MPKIDEVNNQDKIKVKVYYGEDFRDIHRCKGKELISGIARIQNGGKILELNNTAYRDFKKIELVEILERAES